MEKFYLWLSRFIVLVYAGSTVFLLLAGILLIHNPEMLFRIIRILAGAACLTAAFAAGVSFLRGFIAKSR